jgi:DNA-binding NarL/FixJ family response regulator
MPRIVLSLEEWQAVAHELAASHTFTAPPGLTERVRELLTQAHDGWAEQAIALELDEGSAETVRAVHSVLTGTDPNAGQRSASVAEADDIIRDHQRRS